MDGEFMRKGIKEIERRSRWLLVEGIGMANFLTFVGVGMLIGGSAALGKVEADLYYVADHARFTLVSAPVYWYSVVHGATQLITFPLLLVASLKRWVPKGSSSSRGRGTI